MLFERKQCGKSSRVSYRPPRKVMSPEKFQESSSSFHVEGERGENSISENSQNSPVRDAPRAPTFRRSRLWRSRLFHCCVTRGARKKANVRKPVRAIGVVLVPVAAWCEVKVCRTQEALGAGTLFLLRANFRFSRAPCTPICSCEICTSSCQKKKPENGST